MNQRWQLVSDNLPDDIDVDAKVVVDQLVSDSSHILPGNFRMAFAEGRRQPLGCFPDDLQCPNDGILGFGVR